MAIDAPKQQARSSAFEGETPSFPVTRPDYTGGNGQTPDMPVHKSQGRYRQLALGLGFLAPNILGFLTFTAIPLVFSMVLAFSNWDLRLHNMFKDQPIQFRAFSNFIRLFQQDDFYRFLGNTLFFMMGMPFSIAASLGAAILLSKDLRGGSTKVWLGLIAGAVLIASTILLWAVNAQATGMLLLLGGVTGGILIAGTLGGTTVYRTLFYVPHFTAGVATYLLWKKLFNPNAGPITAALNAPVGKLGKVVNETSVGLWHGIAWVCVAVAILLMVAAGRRLRRYWEDGDVGWLASLMSAGFLVLPVILALQWFNIVDIAALSPPNPDAVANAAAEVKRPTFIVDIDAYVKGVSDSLAAEKTAPESISLIADAIRVSRKMAFTFIAATVLLLAWAVFRIMKADRTFTAKPMFGVGTGLMFAVACMVAVMVLMGFASVFFSLPGWAAHQGLETPKWLADVNWAKPSIMLMGFWGAIGSNTMLLYLAALTNVPQELYEAADIDGASRFQKFWNVTWPQLAPTTFFIVVMGVIGGLQGGFEMARVMTQGGPAGSTTTLAYFIYTEGFETGRLGYSSAVAWTLFLMVLLVTLFNWKFGNKYVND
jgi:multiple sugar transport system permease protein